MKEFFELLVEKYGFPEFVANDISLLIYLLIGLVAGAKGIRYFIVRLRKRSMKKLVDSDLHPYFTYGEFAKYTKYYIPQYYQNISPSEGDEPGVYVAAAKSKLMPVFLKDELASDSNGKYSIILADTGMGKTAFLINLYRRYKKFPRHKGIYDIRLFPLGAKDALAKIKEIPDKNNTILLLDAFDEDIKAVNDYRSRMTEILNSVKDFRKVIFTCRTQFFPSKEEEPLDTDDFTFGDNTQHRIRKLYLSAFDNSDILGTWSKSMGLIFSNCTGHIIWLRSAQA